MLAGEFQRLVTKIEARTEIPNLRDRAMTLEYRADSLYRVTFLRRHNLGIKDPNWIRTSLELDAIAGIRSACGDVAAHELFKPEQVPSLIQLREQLLWDKSFNIQLFKKVDAKL